MSEVISREKDLPKWFDISDYYGWELLEPWVAAGGVSDKLRALSCLRMHLGENSGKDLSEESFSDIMSEIVKASKSPYTSRLLDSFVFVFMDASLDKVAEKREQHKRQEALAVEYADQVLEEMRELDGFSDIVGSRCLSKARHVTLLEVMNWLRSYEDIIDSIDDMAKDIVSRHGGVLEEIKCLIYKNIPIFGEHGEPFLIVDGYPSVDSQIEEVRSLAIQHDGFHEKVVTAKISDVRKMFDYRVAAYAILKAWSILEGKVITKKCMARALFPDGEFDGIDMMPSKTVGRFINKLEEGYIDSLYAKSAEMSSMQK